MRISCYSVPSPEKIPPSLGLGSGEQTSHKLNQWWTIDFAHICVTTSPMMYTPHILHINVCGLCGPISVGVKYCARDSTQRVHILELYNYMRKQAVILQTAVSNAFLNENVFWFPTTMVSEGSQWQQVSISSGNDLRPSDNKPLSEPLLTNIYVNIWPP